VKKLYVEKLLELKLLVERPWLEVHFMKTPLELHEMEVLVMVEKKVRKKLLHIYIISF
jgi:hypothetical protein